MSLVKCPWWVSRLLWRGLDVWTNVFSSPWQIISKDLWLNPMHYYVRLEDPHRDKGEGALQTMGEKVSLVKCPGHGMVSEAQRDCSDYSQQILQVGEKEVLGI